MHKCSHLLFSMFKLNDTAMVFGTTLDYKVFARLIYKFETAASMLF